MKINLRPWRERRALTQEELAKKAGINTRTVSRIELGYHARPPTVRKLATALGVDPEQLVETERRE